LPDLFVDAVKPLAVGGVTPELVRSGAGFHILKLIARTEAGEITSTQTRARHILLRPSARLSPEAAARRLAEFRAQIVAGKASFEALAKEHSEDGSAAAGGDLGWTTAGAFVPEFEEAMSKLQPGGISPPIESRFGMHLIQVVERRTTAADPRQLREQARAALREQKYEPAYKEWTEELRSRAYIEMREPPQ
jgi:peptidyl-prolyl cis-trans isomerase SurA